MERPKTAFVLFSIAALGFFAPANAAILTNGGFDDYTSPGSDSAMTSLTPVSWRSGGLSVDHRIDVENDTTQNRATVAAAQGGGYFVAIDSLFVSGTYVYQSFTTVPLQQYELSFWSAPANLTVDLNLGIDVFSGSVVTAAANGDLLDQTLYLVHTTSNGGWTNTTYTFTATSTSSILRFIDQGLVSNPSSSRGGDQLIDSVSITAIPEPSAFAILGLGCLALAARRCRWA